VIPKQSMVLNTISETKKIFALNGCHVPCYFIRQNKVEIRNKNRQRFKVDSEEARFGTHFKMKGVTLNTLDIKISGKDTETLKAE
jgi:hypothetical protein